MLAPPDDLPDAALASALGHSRAIAVASVEYRAVGWGSHLLALVSGRFAVAVYPFVSGQAFSWGAPRLNSR